MKHFRITVAALGVAALSVFAMPALGALAISVVSDEVATRSSDSVPPPAAKDGAAPYPSDGPGALSSPDTWTCDYLLPEYQAWLEAGNNPKDWRMLGKAYVDVGSGKLYDWLDWINWVNDNNCVPVALAKPEALPLIGPGLGLLAGTGAAGAATAADSSTDTDSPG